MSELDEDFDEWFDTFINKKTDVYSQYLRWVAKCPFRIDYDKLHDYFKNEYPEWFL